MAQASTTNQRRFSLNKTKINLFLDIALAVMFVVALEQHFTGNTLHELIGIGMAVALLVHIILHWSWIVSITRTFIRKIFHESRLNYLINLVTFVDMLVIIVTGIAISRTLGLEFGFDQEFSHSLESLHKLSSNFILILVGLHVAMHWKWIINNVRRYILRNPFSRVRATRSAAKPVTVSRIQEQKQGSAS